ncbi:MAG: DUF3298 domain-containing protein [Saprospiraceae bacterium]
MRSLICSLFWMTILSQALAQRPALQYRYWRLEGEIGKQPVAFNLHELTRPYVDPQGATISAPYFFGSYAYDQYQEPIKLYGYRDSSGLIVLEESVGWEILGSMRLNDNWQGSWVDSSGKRSFPVTLRERYPEGSVPFAGGALSDALRLKPDTEDSPTASLSLFWLKPAGASRRVQDFLNNTFLRRTVGDEDFAAGCCPSFEKAFERLRDQLFEKYREEVGRLEPDTDAPEFAYNYESEDQIQILYNQDQTLSVGYFTYLYMGGAHGMYAIEFATYDLKEMRPLTLPDVLSSGYESALEAALQRAARRRAGLKSNESIEGYYFVPSIPITENFYLTGKGIVFGYPPYEIAPYAAGQIDLFVPFTELKRFLVKKK